MSDDNSFSLVNLGKLSEPANSLINRVSDAVGGICRPWQIRRVARAEADADRTKALSKLEISEVEQRAIERMVHEEGRRQENMESITIKAAEGLDDSAKPDDLEDDWIANFYDHARSISNDEMQTLWARVLAGESTKKGSFSRKTVNLLSDLDKNDAEIFQSLCRFNWQVGYSTPVVFNCDDDIYKSNGVTFDNMAHLETLGLVQFNSMTGFARIGIKGQFMIAYCGQPLLLQVTPNMKKQKFPTGQVMLTKPGLELANICRVPGVPGFYDYCKDKWDQYVVK